jgi:hypothetical protein
MKTIEKIKSYSWAITLFLTLIILLRQCGVNRDLDRLEKNSKIQSSYMDSLCTKNELNKSIEIEGLKAEKRMNIPTTTTINIILYCLIAYYVCKMAYLQCFLCFIYIYIYIYNLYL